ncbi:MAG: hypothetical protein K2K97_07925 [Muribaculaceae bacterium]|nr:hypothetical protein [Muribaculaceae bacterium]
MITAIIVIGIIIFVSSAIKGNKKKRDSLPTLASQSNRTRNLSPKNFDDYDRKLRTSERRMDRQRRIWSVLFITNSIYKCQAEHTTKRDWQYLDSAIEAIKEYQPTYKDINTAIRFCQIEYARGYCDHKLTEQDLFIIRNIRQLVATDQLPVNRPPQYS